MFRILKSWSWQGFTSFVGFMERALSLLCWAWRFSLPLLHGHFSIFKNESCSDAIIHLSPFNKGTPSLKPFCVKNLCCFHWNHAIIPVEFSSTLLEFIFLISCIEDIVNFGFYHINDSFSDLFKFVIYILSIFYQSNQSIYESEFCGNHLINIFLILFIIKY